MNLPISSLVVAVSLIGCYQSHVLLGVEVDASTADTSIDPPLDAPLDAPLDTRIFSCDRVTQTIMVPREGCIDTVVDDTVGNYCATEGPATETASAVRLQRDEGERDWYFLIRSRDRRAGYLAVGVAQPLTCECVPQASVSGGDLTRSGVGGDLPIRGTEVELVLDGNDYPVWLRVCDGRPR